MNACVTHFTEPALWITKVVRRLVSGGGVSIGNIPHVTSSLLAGSKMPWDMQSFDIESKPKELAEDKLQSMQENQKFICWIVKNNYGLYYHYNVNVIKWKFILWLKISFKDQPLSVVYCYVPTFSCDWASPHRNQGEISPIRTGIHLKKKKMGYNSFTFNPISEYVFGGFVIY